MAYIGVVPAITITQSDAGDIRYSEVTVTDVTNFVIDFSAEPLLPQEMEIEITMTATYTITWQDSNSIPIQWIGGSEPTLTTGKHLLKFTYDGNGEIFGDIIGLNI